MAGKRPFRRAPVWQRPQGPIISYVREGARVRLDFEYSPIRVAAVKSVKGAKYHPDDKSWSVPFDSVDTILVHKEFPAFRSLNALGERSVVPLDPAAAAAGSSGTTLLSPRALRERKAGNSLCTSIVSTESNGTLQLLSSG